MSWFSSISHELTVSLGIYCSCSFSDSASCSYSFLFRFSSAAPVRSAAGVNSCDHYKDAADLHKQVIWLRVVLLLYGNGFGERASSVNVWSEFISILICLRQVFFKGVFILFLRRILCLFFLYYLNAALKKQIVHWDGFSGVFVSFLTEWFSASIKK